MREARAEKGTIHMKTLETIDTAAPVAEQGANVVPAISQNGIVNAASHISSTKMAPSTG